MTILDPIVKILSDFLSVEYGKSIILKILNYVFRERLSLLKIILIFLI